MLAEVAASDYVVLSSNRLYGTVPHLDERYPYAASYYHHLFAGDLGFRLERAFYRYPSLIAVTILDDTFTRPGLVPPPGLEDSLPAVTWQRAYADESFTVYDHPLVLIFRNEERLTADQMRAIVLSGVGVDS